MNGTSSSAAASRSGAVTLLVGEVGAAAVGIAARLDDLPTVYEASAVCATHFHRGHCPTGLVSLASAMNPAKASLCALSSPPALTRTKAASRLAERIGFTTGAMTTVLDRLEAAGHVERTPDRRTGARSS